MRGLSTHLELEIEASHARGEPLPEGDPVPGCKCPECMMQRAGLDDRTIAEAGVIIRRLAKLHPDERLKAAKREIKSARLILPSPGWLARLAESEHGARKAYRGPGLPLEAAKEVPILEVAAALGLKLKKHALSHRGPCPIHGGEHGNFSVMPKKDSFRCYVCGAAGDGIDLVMAVRGVKFPEAVRELAGQTKG